MDSKHYYFAQIAPFLCFVIFSFFGLFFLDYGAILSSSINVRDGWMPYRDFYWLITPLTLYVQAWLQKILYFLSPVTISMLWKGVTWTFLGFISLMYIKGIMVKLEILKKLPVPFIYIYPISFMLLGPIHETHVGYTPDALFITCIGILFITWPFEEKTDKIKRNIIIYAGYLFLGMGYCFKQEIGLIAIVGGIIYLVVKYTIIKTNKMECNIIIDVLIPIVMLFMAPVILLLYFYFNSAMDLFINSTIVIPSRIRTDMTRVVYSLLTFGAYHAYGSLFSFAGEITGVLLIAYIIDNGYIKKMLDYFTFDNSRTLLMLLRSIFTIGCVVIAAIMLITENPNISGWFYGQSSDYEDTTILAKFRIPRIYKLSYIYIIWIQITLFVYSIIKLKRINKLNIDWVFHYILPVMFLLLILDGALVAGLDNVRGPRIIAPAFIASSIISLIYLRGIFRKFNVSWKTIYLCVLFILPIFILGRINGVFSSELLDPIKKASSYSAEFNCFLDREVYRNMKDIGKIIDERKESKVFVLESDTIFYVLLNKKQPTYSSLYNRDWYLNELDEREIKMLENKKVEFVITHADHERVDSFLYRKYDPVRDYVENNYKVILYDRYYNLWERKNEIVL